MNGKPVIGLVVFAMLLSACTPGAVGITNGLSMTPAEAPLQQTQLSQDAVLYSGPGNDGYPNIDTLAAGSQVSLLGQYGDFVKVETADAQTGFIYISAIAEVPQPLPQLTPADIPWQAMDLRYIFLSDGGSVEGNRIKVVDINGNGTDISSHAGIPLDSAFRFEMSLRLEKDTAEYASFEIMGTPPITSSDWWRGLIRLDIGVNQQNTIQLCVRDGTTDQCGYEVFLDTPADQPFTVSFDDPQGKVMSLIDPQGQVIQTIDFTQQTGINLPDGLFPARNLWLGAWVNPQGILHINSLSFEKQPTGKWNPDAANPTLKQLAVENGILLGTEFSMIHDQAYWQIMQDTAGILAISEFSWKGNWTGRGQYNFDDLDMIVDYVSDNGWAIYGSHLVAGVDRANMPDWLGNSHFTRDEYIEILKEHVQTLVGRYAGRVKIWSVANEAIQRSYGRGGDFWNDTIGPDYIEMCFQWAHEADPDAILILNGDRNDSPRSEEARKNIEQTYQVVKTLKDRGVPIDGVGMQMHFFSPWDGGSFPEKEEVIATMRRFAELEVKIYVTEFSVNLHNLRGTQEEKYQVEANLYRDMLSACLESGVCESFIYWDLADPWTWEVRWLNIPDAAPAMYDGNYQPKPAYYAVREVLSANPGVTK